MIHTRACACAVACATPRGGREKSSEEPTPRSRRIISVCVCGVCVLVCALRWLFTRRGGIVREARTRSAGHARELAQFGYIVFGRAEYVRGWMV